MPGRAEGVLARLLAAAACLGADTAVLVMVGVPLAFLGARAARLEARFDNAAREFGHELRLPAENPSGRDADVGAVLARRDAAQLLLHVRLTEARVGARGAALSAVEARVDARGQRGGVYLNGAWMGFQHLLGVGHLHLRLRSLPLRTSPSPCRRNRGQGSVGPSWCSLSGRSHRSIVRWFSCRPAV